MSRTFVETEEPERREDERASETADDTDDEPRDRTLEDIIDAYSK